VDDPGLGEEHLDQPQVQEVLRQLVGEPLGPRRRLGHQLLRLLRLAVHGRLAQRRHGRVEGRHLERGPEQLRAGLRDEVQLPAAVDLRV
jgi:hypothetical protein